MKQAIEDALNQIAAPQMKLHKVLSTAIAAKMEEKVSAVFWRTADGFPVAQSKLSKGEDTLEGADVFQIRTAKIDPDGQARAITANFIHSLDATHMREVVQAADFDTVMVHDSFGCHAGNYRELSAITRDKFAYIHKFDQVAQLNKLSKVNVEVPELGDYDPAEVEEAPYFFH